MKALSLIVYLLLLIIMKPRHHTNDYVLHSILGTLDDIKSGTDSNPSKNDDSGGITTTSKQLHATQHLFENASRLETCQAMMRSFNEGCEQLLESELSPSSVRKFKKHRDYINKYIGPMISVTKVSIEAAAKKLAPIPSVKRYNEQQEVLRRKAVKKQQTS